MELRKDVRYDYCRDSLDGQGQVNIDLCEYWDEGHKYYFSGGRGHGDKSHVTYTSLKLAIEDDLELLTLLPLPPGQYDRNVPPHPVYMKLGMGQRAS